MKCQVEMKMKNANLSRTAHHTENSFGGVSFCVWWGGGCVLVG